MSKWNWQLVSICNKCGRHYWYHDRGIPPIYCKDCGAELLTVGDQGQLIFTDNVRTEVARKRFFKIEYSKQ